MSLKNSQPCVTRETVRDSIDGNYECYTIQADDQSVEELSLKDIIYIHDIFTMFIDDAKEKKAREEASNGK